MNKRVFWLNLWVSLLLLVLPITGISQQLTDSGSVKPDHVTLTWAENPADSMTITWRTDTTVQEGFIQYQKGNKLSDKGNLIKAQYSVFTSNLGITHIFTGTLKPLLSNAKYTYRVGNSANWSQANTFKTAKKNASQVKLLIFGDSQSPDNTPRPYGMWQDTLNKSLKANPDAEFFINLGDLSDVGQRETHWNAWFKASEGVIDRVPMMPVQGNHETYGDPSNHKPVYYVSQFTLPENGPAGLKEQAYSYDIGPVHFIVLDSQSDEEGNILPAQVEWLEKDLAASKAPWKIAFFHKPPYENHILRTNPDVKKAFCPLFDKYHVDLVFNGHDHALAHTYPINGGKIMEKPSQGTVYYIVGRSGTKAYKDLVKKDWNTFFYNPLDQPVYLVLKSDKNKVTVKSYKQDGTLMNDFYINKKKDICGDANIK